MSRTPGGFDPTNIIPALKPRAGLQHAAERMSFEEIAEFFASTSKLLQRPGCLSLAGYISRSLSVVSPPRLRLWPRSSHRPSPAATARLCTTRAAKREPDH